MAKDAVNYIHENMYENILDFRVTDLEFIARLEQKWNRAFVSSESLYMFISEASDNYIRYVNELDENTRDKKKYIFTVLIYIHGRALQQFLEVTTLLKICKNVDIIIS